MKELLAHPGPGLAAASAADWKLLESGGVISTPFADHMDFKTETGKIMIVNPDQPEPMPRFTSAHGGEYPLRLIAVPSGYTLNSIFLEREDLTGKRGPMELMLHPMDAALRNIRDGDKVTAWPRWNLRPGFQGGWRGGQWQFPVCTACPRLDQACWSMPFTTSACLI